MDYVPLVLGKARPVLDAICSSSGSSRSICLLGRLLALVNGQEAVVVFSLTGQSGRECIISSGTFTRSVGYRIR